MEYIPVKTRTMRPPRDDLFAVLDEFQKNLQEEDVVLISSKVVAIHEGRCVRKEDFDKQAHVDKEAQVVIPRSYWSAPLTITNNVFISSSGVDLSNSDGYYTLLPDNPFESAEEIHKYLCEKHNLEKLGVIITDSRSEPCRYGAVSVSLGFWGIDPLLSHAGKEDLFGRQIKHARTNMVDGIAAGANLVMGEVDESTPVVIARNVPNIKFVGGNQKDKLFCPLKEDTFRVLYEDFLE